MQIYCLGATATQHMKHVVRGALHADRCMGALAARHL